MTISHVYDWCTPPNNINTKEGGTHLIDSVALTRLLNEFLKKGPRQEEGAVSGDDRTRGLVAIVSVKLPTPRSRAAKMSSATVRSGFVVSATMKTWAVLRGNPQVVRKILEKQSERTGPFSRKQATELTRRRRFGNDTPPGKLATAERDTALCGSICRGGFAAGRVQTDATGVSGHSPA